MLDYDALHALEKKYQTVQNAPENDPQLIKLRKSIGKPNHRDSYRTRVTDEELTEIKYYYQHGIHSVRKIASLMRRSPGWVTIRLDCLGIDYNKKRKE